MNGYYINSRKGWRGVLACWDWFFLHFMPVTLDVRSDDPLFMRLPHVPGNDRQSILTRSELEMAVGAMIPIPQAYDVLQSVYIHMEFNGITVPRTFPFDTLHAEKNYHLPCDAAAGVDGQGPAEPTPTGKRKAAPAREPSRRSTRHRQPKGAQAEANDDLTAKEAQAEDMLTAIETEVASMEGQSTTSGPLNES